MIDYLAEVKALTIVLEVVDRENNARLDSLSKLATSDHYDLEGSVYIETLAEPSLKHGEIMEIDIEPSWMDPIITCLIEGKLPENQKEA